VDLAPVVVQGQAWVRAPVAVRVQGEDLDPDLVVRDLVVDQARAAVQDQARAAVQDQARVLGEVRGLVVRGLVVGGLVVRGLVVRGLVVRGLVVDLGRVADQGQGRRVVTTTEMAMTVRARATAELGREMGQVRKVVDAMALYFEHDARNFPAAVLDRIIGSNAGAAQCWAMENGAAGEGFDR
jgi:hypothetical protein